MKKQYSLVTMIVLSLCSVAAVKVDNFHLAGEIPFRGNGGWDYLSLDASAHRLYVSHADRVVVIDVQHNKIVGEISDTPGVHGIAIGSNVNLLFSSNGNEGKVSFIDLKTLSTLGKVTVGENPDAIVYEQTQKEVYAFNGKSDSVSIIDARSKKVVATVTAPGKPEFAAVDSEAHRVFFNIEDKSLLLGIDTNTHQVTESWKLPGCDSPTGLALDTKNHRSFSVCKNQKMIILNTQTGEVLSSIAIGEGADGVAFDPKLGLAFSANGKSGTVTVVHEDSPKKFTLVGDIKTKIGARTITLDPTTHRIYLPTADFSLTETGTRPKPLNGTQRVLVLERY